MEKEISLKKYIIFMIVLGFIEAFIMCYIVPRAQLKKRAEETREHCKLAVCNEDATICYNYDMDKDGNTIVTWRGSCKK